VGFIFTLMTSILLVCICYIIWPIRWPLSKVLFFFIQRGFVWK